MAGLRLLGPQRQSVASANDPEILLLDAVDPL